MSHFMWEMLVYIALRLAGLATEKIDRIDRNRLNIFSSCDHSPSHPCLLLLSLCPFLLLFQTLLLPSPVHSFFPYVTSPSPPPPPITAPSPLSTSFPPTTSPSMFNSSSPPSPTYSPSQLRLRLLLIPCPLLSSSSVLFSFSSLRWLLFL
jgi:hypothetical protein